MKNRDFARVSIPAWYYLSLKGTFLSIIVHPKVVSRIEWFGFFKRDYIDFMLKEHPLLDDFIDLNDSCFGFGGVLKRVGEYRGWIRFGFELPVMHKVEESEEESVSAARLTMNLRATLGMFFSMLHVFSPKDDFEDTDSRFSQLIVIEHILLGVGHGDAGIAATLTPSLARWLSEQSDCSHIVEVVKVMKEVFFYIWQGKESSSSSYRFGALCRQPKWLNIDLPGDACGLDPETYHDKSLHCGYQLVPHNVDSPLQQFTILAGLAALDDFVRRSVSNT